MHRRLLTELLLLASPLACSAAGSRVSVLQHHNDLARDGHYVDAAFTQAAAANLAIDPTFADANVTGNVYAQPLYFAGSAGAPDLVIAATEMNNVYAFNAATGAVVWTATPTSTTTATLGTPISHPTGPGGSGNLPCGNITPNVGVTGTPVIDGSTGTLYFDAFQNNTDDEHVIHALVATTGTERSGWPVSLEGNAMSNGVTFSSYLQNQRGALTVVGGKVIIPFSGHVGDCGGYHGWVIGITTGNSPTISAWATRAVAGGIWGASGIASDGTSLFFATGNSKSSADVSANTSSGDSDPNNWGDSETVFKFPTSLASPAMTSPGTTTDYFVPSNWVALDDADQDMGGTSPTLVTVPGATPSSLVVAVGKDGYAYLLDRSNLGGMDATPLAKASVSPYAIISAMASYTTSMATYVVFRGTGGCPTGQTGGLVALKISATNPPTISTAWCGGPAGAGSPAVSQTDSNGSNTIVWSVGSDNKLYGVDGDTGTSVFGGGSTAMSAVNTIQTPIVANGRIFVASNSQVYAWKP